MQKKKFSKMDLQKAASKAIFELQLNSKEAVRFVERRSKVDTETAKKAIEDAPIWYKLSNS